ncbi:MAG: pyridoxamine 5'-phosphate oxidase family protein [Candidatus Colwellbacteria bacterium]
MPLNKHERDKLLNETEIAYIATTRPDGRPHVMPIWFIYHEGKIYFETDATTTKFKNIQHNNKVMIVFGGKSTYIVEGSVQWCKENELSFPIRKMYWEKYGEAMDDSYITEKTFLFELIPEKEQSWHYAPNWD